MMAFIRNAREAAICTQAPLQEGKRAYPAQEELPRRKKHVLPEYARRRFLGKTQICMLRSSWQHSARVEKR